MNKMNKIFALVLIVALVSLGLTGCKDKSEHPTGDHPTTSEETTTNEHPTTSEETTTNEHPTTSEETTTNEHPAVEQPK